MPLPPAIEFLAAQATPGGNRLCHFAITQVSFVLPANSSASLTILPSETAYMDYWFRLMADASMVPGAARIEVFQAGAPAYLGTAFSSSLDRELDFFVRRTRNAPTTTRATNLTNLNQQFIFYSQFLVVATEEDYKELERRLAQHFTLDLAPVLQAILEQAPVTRLVPTPEREREREPGLRIQPREEERPRPRFEPGPPREIPSPYRPRF